MAEKLATATTAPDPPGEDRTQRVQLDFSRPAYERLLQIKALSDARTNAEVVRKALQVYEWLLTARKADYAVQLVKGDSVKEVELIV